MSSSIRSWDSTEAHELMEHDEKAFEKYRISIVKPVLHEGNEINPLIEHLFGQKFCEDCEIIVVDGDPDGETISAIRCREVKSIISARGRAQ